MSAKQSGPKPGHDTSDFKQRINEPVCHCFFSFFFGFFAKATGRTVRPIWTNEGSKRVVPLKEVPLGGLKDVCLNFGGKIPQKLKFWGRE